MTAVALDVLRHRFKSTARTLVLKYGDMAEQVVYTTLSGNDLVCMVQAIKEYRAYKEEGWRVVG